jgi:hypothetical protein
MGPPFFLLQLLILAFWLVVVGGGGYLLVRFVRAYERRALPPSDLAAVEERLHQMEESNLRLESEVARLVEAQRFTTQLLAERNPERPEP